jgi:hypothetical protein
MSISGIVDSVKRGLNYCEVSGTVRIDEHVRIVEIQNPTFN